MYIEGCITKAQEIVVFNKHILGIFLKAIGGEKQDSLTKV